jgi:tetratricopeptide (TPR) repeat protein
VNFGLFECQTAAERAEKKRMPPRKKPVVRHRPPPELAKAMALWGERRFDEALRCFNEAVRQAPNDPSVLIDAARALGSRYQTERSMALLGRALRLGPRRAEVQHAVGESYRMLGRTDDAEACFRRALRLVATPHSQLELAKICERRHALDEAADLVAQALRGEPQSSPALLLRARIERRRGEVDKAHATLRQLTAATSQPAQVLAEAHGELSILLDGAGEYGQAWDAILKCKQILLGREQAAWIAAQSTLDRCKLMMDALTPEHLQRWRREAEFESTQQLALLTGFPRSGTTLLEQVLAAHPDIVETEEREIFSGEVFPALSEGQLPEAPLVEILDKLSQQQILDARQQYLGTVQAVLGEPIGPRLHLDKNPAMNLMIPPMKRVFPELKLVIALRDPRDVVVSCFLRYLPMNPVSVCFLTLERTVDRFVLDMGAWLKMRPMIGDWVEVRYEDTIADLRHEAMRILKALDVSWNESILEYLTRNSQKQVRSPSYEEVARPIFTTSIGRWQNYERQLAPILDRLTPLLTALGYEK